MMTGNMELRLARVTEYNGSTMGVLCFNDDPAMLTLEEAWRDNATGNSCIPEGRYRIVRHRSPRFGITFLVKDVPGRSFILFHPGNTSKDTEGCILVGEKYGDLNGEKAVLNSVKAFQKFLKILSGIDEAQLVVVSLYGDGVKH